MFGNVLRETAYRRALAAIINILDIEIISRRDITSTAADRAELRMFILSHKSFMKAWDALNPDCNPVSYAIAWDSYLHSARYVNNARMEQRVQNCVRSILSDVAIDIENLLPVSSIDIIRRGEQALSEIVAIDKQVVLI